MCCQWRSLPSFTWPKQKMQPSAPFTTDWMTSATVPEHTSACGKTQRDRPFTVSLQFEEHCKTGTVSIWHCLHQFMLLVSVFFIIQVRVCLFVNVCFRVLHVEAICFSRGPLGQGFSSKGPFPYITQQTRPLTAEQLVVTVSHQQCCPSSTI